MSDIQQIKAGYSKYRYSIPQLLELSDTACSPFDLSRFTYEAARAGIIPSLENCTMASRQSSASYTKASNVELTNDSDVLLFQGNRVVHPGRQPKIPPPVERQKDEGFARFLKKHASPTHNRVTAGGRIVPMEPKSPPAFALSSPAANPPEAALRTQDLPAIRGDQTRFADHLLEGKQTYQDSEWPPRHPVLPFQMSSALPQAELRNNVIPVFVPRAPQQAANSLVHPQMDVDYLVEPPNMPSRSFLPDQYIGGPVMPQQMRSSAVTYHSYYSPSAAGSVLPASNEFGSGSAWSAFDNNYGMQDMAPSVMPAYQLLVAWEQHYFDLDMQLKNIDRHRAMHQLDPYLADQRKEIVQRRSDAKDVIKECQMTLGLRRMTDTSQDSFATSFNVDVSPYVPAGVVESIEPQFYAQPREPVQSIASTDKPRASATRRAIPIISPPKLNAEEKRSEPAAVPDGTTQDMDVDEWGVQKRSAPPDIHREQSRLSDMIQAEQRRSACGRDDGSQHGRDSQPSVGSQKGVVIEDTFDAAIADPGATLTPFPQPALDDLPRDNADEMQRVMDAISKPKGTTTRVRLLDNRVIDVEGQNLSLSVIENPPRKGRHTSNNADPKSLTPSASRSKLTRSTQTQVANTHQNSLANGFIDKENILVAPQGHQKAATDAFLAQFNAVEDNVALTTRTENRATNVASARIVEELKRTSSYIRAPNDLLGPGSIDANFTNFSLKPPQHTLKTSVMDQDSAIVQTTTSTFADDLMNKAFSSVSVQNVNAVGRLPQNFDGAVDARQIAHAHLAAAEKVKSPRLFKRAGANGSGAWYGPFSRDMFDRARTQSSASRSPKKHNA